MTTAVIARAKINLALAVTGRRADGYHDLRSVFVRVGVADRLSATVRPDSGDDDRLTIDGDPALSVIDNLVIRAVALLRDAFGGAQPGLQLRLDKRIPVGSGMGGGSADAAAALDVAAATWGIALDADVRDRLAVRLSADVLFFARGHEAALVSGSGDEIRRLPPLPGNPGLLVVIPPFGITTAAVYGAFDELPAPTSLALETVDALVERLEGGGLEPADLVAWSDALADANDLWPSSIRVAPSLTAFRASLEDRLGRRVLMTGSGSALIGLYPSPEAAAAAGQSVVADFPSALRGTRMLATDPRGPDPIWRYP